MSTPKHTPGPWESAWDLPEGESPVLDAALGSEWLIRTTEGELVVSLGYYDGPLLCASEPDCRLISAAPDLLAALEMVLAVVEYVEEADYRHLLSVDQWKQAQDAIAKARGES
ncbi:MAG: hypothetical protein H3C62_14055 [Gemmatimonadaceae bacterium]|nr:hypothetical protein [Gemmatimonadaceae bacterium]